MGFLPDDGVGVGYDEAIALDVRVDRSLGDLPVELCRLDGFLSSGGLMETCAQTVPGSFLHVEHGSEAVSDHEVV